MANFPTQQEQIVDYLKKNMAKGYTSETLKYSLLSQGYTRTAVLTAIETANKDLAKAVPKHKEKPQITYKVVKDKSTRQFQEKPIVDIEQTPNLFQRLLRKFRK